jgi:23S rRNA pseudouridine2605 synthase
MSKKLPRKNTGKPKTGKPKVANKPTEKSESDNLVRLNRYIANSGVCSRREADKLIEAGEITVNGKTVTELGFKVSYKDKITYQGKILNPEKKVYLLLNKPKNYITTLSDPQERSTVFDLIKGACEERIYPVGRLDRQTTGLLLFTNDGELAKKLSHPSYEVEKIYHVVLNKNLKPSDLDSIKNGLELEDGPIKVDDIAYIEGSVDKSELGVKIHSGRNRIVRRIFEHLGYQIDKLDRVIFAGLTKKDIPRGKYRFLSPKEVQLLKNMK